MKKTAPTLATKMPSIAPVSLPILDPKYRTASPGDQGDRTHR
jgi:hypothetical protein